MRMRRLDLNSWKCCASTELVGIGIGIGIACGIAANEL